MPEEHTHQCGRIYSGMISGYGCGHVWSHTRDESRSMKDDHMCPQCGRGPWYTRVESINKELRS